MEIRYCLVLGDPYEAVLRVLRCACCGSSCRKLPRNRSRIQEATTGALISRETGNRQSAIGNRVLVARPLNLRCPAIYPGAICIRIKFDPRRDRWHCILDSTGSGPDLTMGVSWTDSDRRLQIS
uniref:HDC19873 n=1 Tax=Drosophila melanogaster TaxID=7227 RepID=Q6II36_DROME|nr:TPA_inf: HDC19873 [Drosophila melanogaster]